MSDSSVSEEVPDAPSARPERWGRYRPALDRTGNPETARDIAQDAFELAVRHVGELRDAEARPDWLRTIALNCCRQHLRRPREPVVIAQLAESAYRAAV